MDCRGTLKVVLCSLRLMYSIDIAKYAVMYLERQSCEYNLLTLPPEGPNHFSLKYSKSKEKNRLILRLNLWKGKHSHIGSIKRRYKGSNRRKAQARYFRIISASEKAS